MSNLSLARIMYGSNEELRRGVAYRVPAKVASFALLPATQPPASFSEVLRRIWLRFSAKS
jgi:hypothetical protein